MRRRQRRLRSWLRHERMTVAMALAEMTHHTAPRGPTMARVGEGVEHEQLDGLRAQKPPLPGVRPGSLFDPGPQRSDRTVRHSAGDTPLLVVPALRGDDGVDGTTLRFLLEQNLSLKKRQEEEEKEREWREQRKVMKAEFMALMALPSFTPLQESRTRELVEALEAHDACKPSSGSSRRKRKKRKKRRLPRVPRHGGRRLRAHAARVPAVLRVPGASVSVPRQSVGHSCYDTETDTLCSPWVGCYAPVVAQRQVPWFSAVACARLFCWFSSSMAVVCARLVLMVTMHFALCSLWLAGPRCSASWPVWTRRTVAVVFTRRVLLVTYEGDAEQLVDVPMPQTLEFRGSCAAGRMQEEFVEVTQRIVARC